MNRTAISFRRNLLLLLLVAATGALRADDAFKAGASTSNITPSLGAEIIGGFVPFPSTNVHDDLHARCLVLDDGDVKLALVVCDLLGIDRVVSDEARRIINERYDIPPDRVLISATHTHSACSALGEDSRRLDQSIDDYQRFVAVRIADGVGRALKRLRPAEIGFGTVDIPEHVFNRRWYMKAGTVPVNPFGQLDMVKMNPPRGSKNLTEPAGPIDPTVSFLSVRRPDGIPVAVFAAYSLHYVGGVGKGDVSADYFGVFCRRLERLLFPPGADSEDVRIVAIMANATSGDINNINFRQPRPRQSPYEQIRHVGNDVADRVHAAMSDVAYKNEVTLDAAYREPTIAWRLPTTEQREWAEKTIDAGRQQERDLPFIYAQRTLRQAEYPESTTVPLQVLRIGDVCIGSMPFEVFCEIGLDFRSRCPIKPAFMVELAHGYFGYLPTPRHHKLGGYETWLGTNRVEVKASDILLDQLLEMADQLDQRRNKP